VSLTEFDRGRGQRAASFRFELLDNVNSLIGDLDGVEMSSAPRVSNRINRAVKRTLDGLRLPPAVTREINTLSDRVRVWMRFEDATEWPLGVFLFADASRTLAQHSGGYYAVLGAGHWTDATCLDQLVTVNQGSRGINFYAAGHRVYDALVQQLEAAGIRDYDIDASEAVISQPIVWKPNHNRLTIINELAALGGYYSLYFDGLGRGQVRKVPELAAAEPTVSYDLGSAVLLDSIAENDDLLSAPNTYVVVNSSFTERPIWGEWQVPSSAPHSFEVRRYHVVVEDDMQGVETSEAAAEAARAWGQSDYSTYRTINYDTPPMPEHDTFDVVRWLDGDRYREQGWDLTCLEGAAMSHEARRIWSDSVADFLAEAA
jgi:hypothetical protein